VQAPLVPSTSDFDVGVLDLVLLSLQNTDMGQYIVLARTRLTSLPTKLTTSHIPLRSF